MHALKLIQVGESVGLVLPQDVVAALNCRVGDTVFLAETAAGLMLTSHHRLLQDQFQAGRDFIRDYRGALRLLAE